MPILTQQSDTTSTPGRVPVTTGVNGVYATRDRILSGTLVARDALSPVYEGDRWLVSSGASSGTLWEYVNTAWSFVPVGADADAIATSLGAVPASRTIAGSSLASDISTNTLKSALGVASATFSLDVPLDAAQGWNASGVTPDGNLGTSAASFLGGGVVRLTIGSTGSINSIGGPAVERAITWKTGVRWRFRVTPVAAVNTSGSCFGALYLRGAGTSNNTNYYMSLMYASDGTAIANGWAPGFAGGVGGAISWGGGGTLEIHVGSENNMTFGAVKDNGLWLPLKTETLAFVPAFVGVCGACDTSSVGRVDFRDLIIECLG